MRAVTVTTSNARSLPSCWTRRQAATATATVGWSSTVGHERKVPTRLVVGLCALRGDCGRAPWVRPLHCDASAIEARRRRLPVSARSLCRSRVRSWPQPTLRFNCSTRGVALGLLSSGTPAPHAWQLVAHAIIRWPRAERPRGALATCTAVWRCAAPRLLLAWCSVKEWLFVRPFSGQRYSSYTCS